MIKTHEMRINSDYFSLIEKGLKQVELRLNDRKRKSINPGDKIKFICRDLPENYIECSVIDIIREQSFCSVLSSIPEKILGGYTKQEQLEKLRNIYTGYIEKQNGVVAFILGEIKNG